MDLKPKKYSPHRGLWMASTELPKVRKEIKEKIEKLTYRDVRREQISLQNALMKELLEDGCTKFAEYFGNILEKEKLLYNNKIINKKISAKEGLENFVVENFYKAEKALRSDNDLKKCLTVVFDTARQIESNYGDYKWLSKECWEIALNLLLEGDTNGANDEEEARVRFFYGKFCLEKLHLNVDAIKQLTIANRMSRGMEWLTSQDSIVYLHKNCCYYLGQTYVVEAKRIYLNNIDAALEMTNNAIESLAECNAFDHGPCDRTLYVEACLLRCRFLIRNAEYNATLELHSKVQGLIYSLNEPTFKCEMLLQQGICYLWLENLEKSLRKLKSAIELAEMCNLISFKALSLVEIAKIYSKSDNCFNLAQESLAEAHKMFEQINDMKNLKKVNYFSAILKTQEILPRYIKLMKDSDNSQCDMINLRSWKSYVKPFWIEKNEDMDEKIPYKCILKEMEFIENTTFE